MRWPRRLPEAASPSPSQPRVLQKAADAVEMTSPKPPESVAQEDRVLVVGVATGKIKARNKPCEDHWVFDITIRDGRLATIRGYIDTQAMHLGRADGRVEAGMAKPHRWGLARRFSTP